MYIIEKCSVALYIKLNTNLLVFWKKKLNVPSVLIRYSKQARQKLVSVHYTVTFSPVKISAEKKMIFFLLLHITLIVGTGKNRLGEAVLISTHILCFEARIRKIGIPLYTPVLLYKSGV